MSWQLTSGYASGTCYDSNSDTADYVTIDDLTNESLGAVQVWTTAYNASGSTQSPMAVSRFMDDGDYVLFLGLDPTGNTLYFLFTPPAWNQVIPYTINGVYHPAAPAIGSWTVFINGSVFQNGSGVGTFLIALDVTSVAGPPYTVYWAITDSNGNEAPCFLGATYDLFWLLLGIPGFCPTCPASPGS